jgi:flagellar basal-body rod protein FlgG
MEFDMSATDKAIGMAIARLSVVVAMAFGIYTIAGRLMDLSTSTAVSLSAIASARAPEKLMPRLPSDVEMSRLHALQVRIDVAANNLANAETEGFKRQRLIVSPASDGSISTSTELDMTQGPLESTGVNTDVAIVGDGFFKIKMPPTVGDGTGYTRNGSLFTNWKGDLVVGIGDGYTLIPNVNIPVGATDVSIDNDGTVNYVPKGGNTSVAAGQIQLSRFLNARGLISQGGCVFLESAESGAPLQSNPGENGAGQLLSGEVEASNVDLLKEQVGLLRAEQLLEQGTKPIHALAAETSVPRLPSDAELSRLDALKVRIDVLANNLANAQTQPFKRQRLIVSPAADGTISTSTALDLTQGSLESTGVNTDVAIEGNGFFKIKLAPTVADGTGFTRNGSLFKNSNGDLVVGIGAGYRLIPNINIPLGATDVSIAQDGSVKYVPKGRNTSVTAGQIQLTQFMNPQGLKPQGGGIYTECNASGPPIVNNPGDNGAGQLYSGQLETSNVDPVKEQVALRKAEQLLEQGTKPIRAASDAIQLIASVKK